ncbi:unnamed protein product [Protopolystoma xenopodis]|uniref:Uncharacterized protein n=1 Tax=Protopolystoma xenopodis TaxID=117903 RepID=A0A448WUB9_9PLAT|nr:unnamed protein product [Protopolystoma xenopodis]
MTFSDLIVGKMKLAEMNRACKQDLLAGLTPTQCGLFPKRIGMTCQWLTYLRIADCLKKGHSVDPQNIYLCFVGPRPILSALPSPTGRSESPVSRNRVFCLVDLSTPPGEAARHPATGLCPNLVIISCRHQLMLQSPGDR